MDEKGLKERTKLFAIRIIKLVDSLPKKLSSRTIGGQLIRSGTSVGANYRAACNARSKKEFIAKLGVVLEESDESQFWLELIIEANIMKEDLVKSLYQEASELSAIFAKSLYTAKSK